MKGEGTHVQAFLRQLAADPKVALVEIHVYPVPAAMAQDIYLAVRDAVNKLLTDRQIASGDMTELPPAGGTIQ